MEPENSHRTDGSLVADQKTPRQGGFFWYQTVLTLGGFLVIGGFLLGFLVVTGEPPLERYGGAGVVNLVIDVP